MGRFVNQIDVWESLSGINSVVDDVEGLTQEIESWHEYTTMEWKLTPEQAVQVYKAIHSAKLAREAILALQEAMHPLRFAPPMIGYTTEEEYEQMLEEDQRLQDRLEHARLRGMRFFIGPAHARSSLPTISSR